MLIMVHSFGASKARRPTLYYRLPDENNTRSFEEIPQLPPLDTSLTASLIMVLDIPTQTLLDNLLSSPEHVCGRAMILTRFGVGRLPRGVF
jgi:hypothetical protein